MPEGCGHASCVPGRRVSTWVCGNDAASVPLTDGAKPVGVLVSCSETCATWARLDWEAGRCADWSWGDKAGWDIGC